MGVKEGAEHTAQGFTYVTSPNFLESVVGEEVWDLGLKRPKVLSLPTGFWGISA